MDLPVHDSVVVSCPEVSVTPDPGQAHGCARRAARDTHGWAVAGFTLVVSGCNHKPLRLNPYSLAYCGVLGEGGFEGLLCVLELDGKELGVGLRPTGYLGHRWGEQSLGSSCSVSRPVGRRRGDRIFYILSALCWIREFSREPCTPGLEQPQGQDTEPRASRVQGAARPCSQQAT